MVSFVTDVEDLDVEPDAPAKVVIDEVSGVMVMGDDVRISTVAIAQGNLTITVQETPQVSQPAPFSQGQTTVVAAIARSRSTRRRARSCCWSAAAPRCRPWSPASTRWASRRAT